MKNSLEAGNKINITTDHYRMPTLVEDLAKATISIMDVEGRGIYHISGSELFSIYDIAQKVADFWSLDSSLILPVHSSSIKSTVSRPSVTGFSLEKARKDLGFQPRTLKEGLALLNSQLIRTTD
jgi:dTDP-4-dehydrorhamnose reductase